MPPESPRRPNAGWRGAGKPTGRSPAADPGWKKQAGGWKKEGTAPSAPWRLSRRTRFGLAFGSVLTLVVALAVLIYYIWPPQPAALILAGAGYETNLGVPHNAHGWRGLNDLDAWAQTPGDGSWFGTGRMRRLHGPTRLTRRDDWAPERWGAFREKTLVVFLSLHGAADDKDGYFLLDAPQDGQRADLPLSAVLDGLKTVPPDKNLVLVLDTTQLTDHWPSGFMHNDLARRLRAEGGPVAEALRKQSNLVVLCASDENQRSWVSDEWGRTIYTHYLLEGLRGAADRRSPNGEGNGDGRISLLELHKYTTDRVARWARDNRAAAQTPLLLPAGAEGERRAEQIDLVTVNRGGTQSETPPAEAPHREFQRDQLERLDKAWKVHDELKAGSPSPTATVPLVWRQYEATLMRCDELTRAGAAEAAEPLFNRLEDLRREIGLAPRLDLSSRINSLSLAALTGEPASEKDAKKARDVFNLLWDAVPAQRLPKWEEQRGEAGDAERRLRLLLAERLLERVGKNAQDVAELRTAHDILRVTDRGGNDRPVEAHLLALYSADLEERAKLEQPAPDLPDLRLVLQTSRMGEETVLAATRLDRPNGPVPPYAEAVYPWVRQRLSDADALRRRGENLLFAGEDRWGEARGYLRKAQEGYQAVRDRADGVRRAHAVCDEAANWLPWYARFRALSQDKEDVALEPVEELARQVEELQAALETPAEGKEVAERAANTETALQQLQKQFREQCEELAHLRLRLQSHWHQLDAVLTVPSIQAETRLLLLENLRRTGHDLNDATGKADAPDAPPFDARGAAQRQARMALAAVSDRWVVECMAKDPAAPQRLRNLIRAPGAGWQESLLSSGHDIGICWRRAAGRVAEIHERPADELPRAEDEAREAARLGRLADGSGAYLLREVKKLPDPVLELRRLRVRDFLHALAERTGADHWWSEGGRETPYYHVAGLRYVRDADALRLHNPALQRQREEASKQLETRLRIARLDLTNVTGPSVADEGGFEVKTALKDDDRVPRGDMVVWLKTGPGVEPKPAKRTVREVGSNPLPYTVTLAAGGVAGKVGVVVQARYRGQVIDCPVEVTADSQPNIVVYRHPPPRGARVAAVAPAGLLEELDWEQMRISIVFDCSGSMYGGPRGGRRVDDAMDALRTVLRELPPGPTVSLWAFGHRTDAREKVQRLIKPKAWTPNLAAEFVGAIDARDHDPSVGSPIARAVIKAAESDLALEKSPEDEEGVRVLLLLTDGEDNHFEKGSDFQPGGDVELNPAGESVAKVMRKRFDGRGVQVFVAGFQVDPAKVKQVRDQFQGFEKMDPPGKFTLTNTKKQLTEAFRRAIDKQDLRLRAHETTRGKAVPLTPDGRTELLVTPEESREPSRVLVPGSYSLRIPGVQHQEVELKEGDVLALKVERRKGERTSLGRMLFVDDQKHQRPGRSRDLPQHLQSEWVTSVQQSRLTNDDRGLEMLVSTEKKEGRFAAGGVLRQPRPAFVWFDLRPREGEAAPVSMTVRNVDDVIGYPAPTWRLEAQTWPNKALPRVRQWVRENSPFGDGSLSTQFRHRADESLADLFKPQVRVGGEQVTGLTVRFETVDVEEAPGAVSTKQPAMVVRLEYPEGSPVVANLEELGRGAWHRLYSKTNRYTGVFWPVTEAQAQKKTFTLSLLSIKALQNSTEPHDVAVPADDPKIAPPRALGLSDAR